MLILWLSWTHAGAAAAHDLQRYNSSTNKTDESGAIQFVAINRSDQTAQHQVIVLDKDGFRPICSDLWRTDIGLGKDNDTMTLQPGQSQIFTVQLRYRGMKMKVCTKSIGKGLTTQICKGADFL